MLVYVISQNGQPLMPTSRCGKVRRMLRDKQAKVIRCCPFTIQLLYETGSEVQEVSLGVDAGSKHVGYSATTEKKVLFEADVELRNDIVKLISVRHETRRTRRNRKTRYRKARFDNRKKPKGWLAPSVEQKIQTHIDGVKKVHEILPISEITVEVASFDAQKIKNPEISGKEYQEGEQLGFWNVRQYVLWRDNYECQYCHGKSGDKILEVHHKESRQTGGDSPGNLLTLCRTCHGSHHRGLIKIPPEVMKRNTPLRDSAFMGIMRWMFYNRLKALYTNVKLTYGYITKNTRITHNLTKEHYVDARCVSGHPDAVTDGTVYYIRKVRCHNRQIHKFTVSKGGVRKINQAPYEVKGFRLFDKVLWKNQTCFIFGRRTTGRMDLRLLDGTHVNASVGYKNIKLLSKRNNYLIEQRKVG